MATTYELTKDLLEKHEINSLIHVGGHQGEEIDFYNLYNLDKVIYFEPIKAFSDIISKKIESKNLNNFEVHNIALGSKNTEKEIFVADGDSSDSSSLLKPRPSDITFSNKETVKVKTFKSLAIKDIDLAIIDTQGYELEVLKGFEEELKNLKYLVVEFNAFEGYIGQVVFSDLDKYLIKNSYTRIKTIRKINQEKYNDVNYGDAVYVNNKLIKKSKVSYHKFFNQLLDSKFYLAILAVLDFPFNKKQVKKILKRTINTSKNKFPRLLSVYYKLRFLLKATYLKEPRAHLFWILKRGDNTSYKKFNLNTSSIFFDVGGFEGDYTQQILDEYDCTSYIFEPHPVYFQKLQKRFENNNRVKIFNYGLGGKSANVFLTDEDEGSKITDNKTGINIEIRDIVEVIKEQGIQKIDLLKLNIEGSEYELLEKLIESDEIKKIDKMKIQFHTNIAHHDLRRKKIRENLQSTHKEIWSYYFVWERWDAIK